MAEYPNNSLNDIVTCDISIVEPNQNSTLNGILIVVDAPEESGTATMSGVVEISAASELIEYGYTVDDDAYKAASVVFRQSPKPGELYVIARVQTEGSYESIDVTLDRAKAENGKWYAVYLVGMNSTEDLNKASEWIENEDKIFGVNFNTISSIPLAGNDLSRTFVVYSKDDYSEDESDTNRFMALALMAKCLSYAAGSETWAFKTLAGAVPSKLSASQKRTLDNANVTYYATYASKNITSNMGGKVLSGEWIDVIRFRDWLKNRIQENVFGVLSGNAKLPYTSAGITAVEGAIESALVEGQQNGGVATTEYDADGNQIPGYTVSVPAITDVPEDVKRSRVLKNCVFTAKLSGAIHAVEIVGSLTY